MSWFGKKEEKKSAATPSLPELPRLPELPSLDSFSFSGESKPQISNLPSFPNSSFGKKFSQNAIKDAVSGEKEEMDEGGFDGDEFPSAPAVMSKPLQPSLVRRSTMPQEEYRPKISSFRGGVKEPVFIRIDKFEEAMNMLSDAKSKVSEMESMLGHIKKIKEEEDRELKEWEMEIQKIKADFEKMNNELFSRI